MTEFPKNTQAALTGVTVGGNLTTGDINLNMNSSLPQMEGNPFVPPSPREEGLFGRDEDLVKLHELLQSGKNVCVVSGMGGVGKTELVRGYAASLECQAEFKGGVFYIDARDRQDLAAEIIAWTRWKFKRDLDPALSDAQKVKACWDTWKAQGQKVLLILDDVAKLADNAKYFLPPKDVAMVRVVLTSREVPNLKLVEKLELEVLSPKAALEFLGSMIGSLRIERELSEAKLLCADLGYLPLALELVGAYLGNKDYEDLSLRAMRVKLADKLQHPSLSPDEMPMGMAAQRGIRAAFDLSWDQLQPQAQYLSCVLGVFGAGAIHWDFILEMYQRLNGEALSEDDLKDRWLKTLRKLHLVLDVNKNIYNLHPLVREYFALQLQQLDQKQIQQVFCDVFVKVASNVNISTNLSTFNLIETHLKKTVTFLDHDQDSRLAYGLNQLATLYYAQGRYSEVKLLLLRSLSIKEQQLGADHPDTAITLNNLAGLYQSQGRYSEAESLLFKSLEIRKQKLGVDHSSNASSLNNLAISYKSQGRYDKAELLYLQSLSIYEQELGADHPNTATSLNNLAELYRSQGRYSEAEPLYLRSLSITEQQLGVDHPNTANSLNNLALLYKSQGCYSESELLYLQSLSIYEQQLGAVHPDTANSLNNLANLYYAQNRYSEAELLFLRSLQIREQQLGADHPDTATSFNNLAQLYRSQGRYSEAEPLCQRSLQIREQQLGADHPDTAQSLSNLAFLYETQDKYTEAQALAQRALVIFQNALGNQHPNTQNSLLRVKGLQVQILLDCNKQTLFSILKALAWQAELLEVNTEVMLNLLEEICTNPELLHHLQELLS